MPGSPLLFALTSLLAPQQPDAEMAQRVAALVEDLGSASLGKAAHLELVALGELAAPALAERALQNSLNQFRVVPCLIANEAAARIALRLAVERAQASAPDEEPGPAARRRSSRSRVVDPRALALAIATELAPHVSDAAALCAPLLTRGEETRRLRARLTLSPATPLPRLAQALGDDELLVWQAACELLAEHGEAAAPSCGAALCAAWDEIDRLRGRVVAVADGPDHIHFEEVEGWFARALCTVLPDDPRVPRAQAALLRYRALPPHGKLTLLENLDPRAGDDPECVLDLAQYSLADDDTLCRAALDALARMGSRAAPARDNVEFLAQHGADPESRRLALVVLRRITRPNDAAALANELVDDLAHPTRGARARRELRRAGADAVRALLALLRDDERRPLWPHAIDLLHELMPGAAGAVAPLFATRPEDDAPATWLRLRVAVDLAVAAGNGEQVARQLRAFAAAGDGPIAARSAALATRCDTLRGLAEDASDAQLRAALRGADGALAERAARLLARRGMPSDELRDALAALLTRPCSPPGDPEDDLRRAGQSPRVAAQVLLAGGGTPPPAAFEVAAREGTPSERIDLLRRLPDLPYPPAAKVAAARPYLAEPHSDEVRTAACEALARIGSPAREVVPDLERLAGQRFAPAIARAAQRALRAAQDLR